MKTARNKKILALYGSYQELIVGLFDGSTCVAQLHAENQRLSSYLLVAIQEVLQKAAWQLSDLNFIAVDQGPGAFNSLRAMLATINGLAYASGIPLVGCDGLTVLADALMGATDRSASQLHIVLLNAYNSELYYRIEQVFFDGKRVLVCPPGYATIQEVAAKITQASSDKKSLLYTGNGYSLLIEQAPELAGEFMKAEPSEIIACLLHYAVEQEKAGKSSESLQPLYLKVPTYKKVS
ncbi:MAG: tRNA threonylcarbamoyladenosine biosynthesis protein TsaB [Candidatus Dependentiae bacterium]|nr:tRNA threonylcarbamoyladenosine biosynthesis protein TsaB [Candidatus Dependentiae bacterium]